VKKINLKFQSKIATTNGSETDEQRSRGPAFIFHNQPLLGFIKSVKPESAREHKPVVGVIMCHPLPLIPLIRISPPDNCTGSTQLVRRRERTPAPKLRSAAHLFRRRRARGSSTACLRRLCTALAHSSETLQSSLAYSVERAFLSPPLRALHDEFSRQSKTWPEARQHAWSRGVGGITCPCR
jgi:hypothetical protein